MKKEELLEIGLTEEQANKVFALNGQDIEREKAKTAAAKTELAGVQETFTTAQSELEALKKSNGDIAAVQKQLEELQAKYDTDTQALQNQLSERDYSEAMTRAVGQKELKFTSKSAERAFLTALREKKLALKEGELEGLDSFIEEQKKSDPDAFAPDKPLPRFTAPTGQGGTPPKPVSRAAQIAAQMNQSLYGSPKTEKE